MSERRELEKKILDYIRDKCARNIWERGIPYAMTRREIAEECNIPYGVASRILDKLVRKGELYREAVRKILGFPIEYHYYPYYYRTQSAWIIYASEPGGKTPDPLCEVRTVGVSKYPGKYRVENFRKVNIFTLHLLSPQTYWKELIDTGELLVNYIGEEQDEKIDADEVTDSLPCFWRIGYCERMAIFYRSRREQKLRDYMPDWTHKPLDYFMETFMGERERVAKILFGKSYSELDESEKLEVIRECLTAMPRTGDYFYPEKITDKLLRKLEEWRRMLEERGMPARPYYAAILSAGIKDIENMKIASGAIRFRFNNEEGVVERIE